MRILYILYLLAFPLGMLWVESRDLQGPTICLFRQVTHLDCPSCGMTRAFRAMGRLDVRDAFGYNPLGPVAFGIAAGIWVYALALVSTGGRVQLPLWWRRIQERLLYALLAVYLAVGIGRMIYEVHHPPPPPRAMQVHGGLPGFLGRK